MKHYLVTGGAGFIGSHIVTALVRRGDRVRVLDNLSTGNLENFAHCANQVEFVQGDLLNENDVARAVQGVEGVFHEAALPSVPKSIENPLATHHQCVTATVMLLDQARRAKVRRVVYAASSSAYGDQPYSSKREIDLPQPLSPYAAAKLAGEFYAQAFHHSFGLETVCIRYFNVFGPRQDPNSPYSAVIPRFITAILSDQQPVIYGDGLQSRDFTYVENVVHGKLLAMDAAGAVGHTINVADGRRTSLLDLLTIINRLLGTTVEPIHEPARIGDVRESLADITQARELLKYEPQLGLEEGLRRSIEYYKKLVLRP